MNRTILLLVIFAFSACAKKAGVMKSPTHTNINCADFLNAKSGLTRQNIRGRVSAYQSTVYGIIQNANKIVLDTKPKKNTVRYSCEYDTIGNCKEFIAIYYRDENAVYKTENIYDNKNQNTEERIYKIENLKTNLVRKNVFRFDNNGELFETIQFVGDSVIKGKTTRMIDKINNTSKELSYAINGSLIETISLKFDDHGNEIERDTFHPLTKTHSIEKKTYDSANNQIRYMYDGEIGKFGCTYKYDDRGNQIDKLCGSPTNLRHEHNDYEYDSQCNWIRKVQTVNESPQDVTLRKIQYY